MAQIVKLKRTSVAGRIPTTSNIEVGELAFNSNDKSLFIRGDSNAIVAIHDESTLHIDTTNNRIGIGTTNPQQLLHITNANPSIRIQESDVTNGFADILYNSGRLRIRARADSANAGISFEGQAGSTVTEYARFNLNGFLGIGTTNPGEPLHIKNSDAKIKLEDSDGTNQVGTVFQSGAMLGIQSRDNTSHGSIKFQGYNGTTGLEYARFNASGNFGIGTTSPGSKLTVEGDIRQTTGDLLYSGGGNYNIKHLVNDQNITFDTTTGGTTSERMRITSTGDVIIGTSSAQDSAHFQHYQSAARHQSFQSSNGDLAIVTDNNTNPAVYILSLIHISEPTRPY